MTLHDLLTLSGICNYDRAFWFSGSQLKGDVLVVPEKAQASFISHCWLPAMQVHVPGLQVIVAQSEPIRQKPEGKSLWNAKGKAHHAKRLNGLDEL